MKLAPLPWLLLLLVSAKNAAASDQTPFKIRSFLDHQIKQVKQSHINSERMRNADNSDPRISCELSLRLNTIDKFFPPTVPTINESEILDALQGNEKPRLINLIKDLIIANKCQEECSSILRFIRHQEGTESMSNARHQDIPMTEISTLCSLIQKDRSRISAQSINQFLQPCLSSILKIVGALSLVQTLIHYLGENKTIILGAPTILATLGLLNHPFYKHAEERRDGQRKLAEVHEKLQGKIPTLQ